MELISIIVPIYNSQEYLGQCLDSVIAQTYQKLEIILVDDGSTDGSYDICKNYVDVDNRVKLLHTENGGEASARKAGFYASSGAIITFVDSDDWLETDAIERMYAEMEMQDADIVVTGFMETRGEKGRIVYNRLPSGVYQGERLRTELFPTMLCHADYFELGLWPYFWNKMFRRGVLEPCIVSLNEELVVGVDAVGTFPAFLNAKVVSIMHEAFYHYRIHPKSIMHKFRSEKEEVGNIKTQYREMKRLFVESGFGDILAPQLRRYILHHFMVRAALYLEKALRARGMSLIGKMHEGAKVVLYGAGAFGVSLHHGYQQTGDCSVAGWCDRNYQELQEKGYPVVSEEEALGKTFDYVIIAVLNEEVKRQIERALVLKGIKEEKIKWIDVGALEKIDLDELCMNWLPDDFSIFGAGRSATSVAAAIDGLWNKKPRCFVVSDLSQAPEELCGCPVIGLEQYAQEQKGILLLAIPETQEVEDTCQRKNILYQCVSGGVENRLLGALYEKEGRFLVFHEEDAGKQAEKKKPCRIYMAKSAHDRRLENEYQLSAYISRVYAGAACEPIPGAQEILSADVLNAASFRDDMGDNISLQNPYYCELTVLYWAWKNAKEDYVGLCHYRRVFDLTDGQLEALLAKQPDAILVYPSIQYPNAGRHESRYLNSDVRQAVREALKRQSLQLYQDYENIMNDKYIYNFNMLLAKKEVLDRYCQWLFGTIRQIEDICRERGIMVERRQQGYWAEDLMSLYFLTNREGFSIYHAGHKLLV